MVDERIRLTDLRRLYGNIFADLILKRYTETRLSKEDDIEECHKILLDTKPKEIMKTAEFPDMPGNVREIPHMNTIIMSEIVEEIIHLNEDGYNLLDCKNVDMEDWIDADGIKRYKRYLKILRKVTESKNSDIEVLKLWVGTIPYMLMYLDTTYRYIGYFKTEEGNSARRTLVAKIVEEATDCREFSKNIKNVASDEQLENDLEFLRNGNFKYMVPYRCGISTEILEKVEVWCMIFGEEYSKNHVLYDRTIDVIRKAQDAKIFNRKYHMYGEVKEEIMALYIDKACNISNEVMKRYKILK